MRAKIMLLHFALLLLQLLDVATATTTVSTVDPIALGSQKEMGSRSMLGNASVRSERDFRFVTSIYKLKPPDVLLRKEKPKVVGKADSKLNDNSSKRIKRSKDSWISSEIDGTENFLKMHAFIVRDEDTPECDTPADNVTKRRYFMCSGVILDGNHVLTSATCVNQAHIHEHHIEADLAVLIGALDENSYIIKIAHYEIHPRYVPDPNSIHHATNNIALLRLSCSIPRKYVVVPKLPSKRFEDIAHLCCPDRCKLSTIVANSKNQHIIRLIKLKHLPSPMHVEIRNFSSIKKSTMKSSLSWNNQVEQENINKELSLENPRSRMIRQLIHDGVKTINLTDSSESPKSVNYFSQDDEESIDWEEVKTQIYETNVSEKNQKLLSNFVQNSMSDVMTKLLEVMTHNIADINNIFSYFQNTLQQNVLREKDSYLRISDLIGKNILKFALQKMSIIPESEMTNCPENYRKCAISENINVESQLDNKETENTVAAQDELHTSSVTEAIEGNKSERSNKGENKIKINEIGKESERLDDFSNEEKTVLTNNVYCPPLGSPVFVNNTLVALIAYTCDDVQNWVEWKYVNIVQNIRWIRRELKKNLTEDFNLVNMYYK